jgi:hypothetical protein
MCEGPEPSSETGYAVACPPVVSLAPSGAECLAEGVVSFPVRVCPCAETSCVSSTDNEGTERPSKYPKGGRKPINAKAETVARLPGRPTQRRRCIVPVDGFFEWKAIKGQKAKQPFAIAMKDGSPFGIAGLWENWKDPTRRVGPHVHDRDRARERAGRRHSRPYACDPARGLRPMARARSTCEWWPRCERTCRSGAIKAQLRPQLRACAAPQAAPAHVAQPS